MEIGLCTQVCKVFEEKRDNLWGTGPLGRDNMLLLTRGVCGGVAGARMSNPGGPGGEV